MNDEERARADLLQAAFNELIAKVFIYAHDKSLSHSQRLVFIKEAAGKAQLRYRDLTEGEG
jgi:hypothetical protein